jgi:2,3-bisphosphoglycerate-dependent phosphoglycerate mutase
MKRRCRNRFATITLALGLAALSAAPSMAGADSAGTTTFLLVRHAEKEQGDDPALTAAGTARAEELARVVADLGVDAIYSTRYKRTQETARPTAKATGIDVQLDAIRPADLAAYYAEFTQDLIERHAGKRVLLVGHSNTVPMIIEALGAAGAPSLGENDYDDLFVVIVPPSGEAEMLHLHYGKVTP